MQMLDPATWRGRKVLLTGHTGFKGAWMLLLLERLGAQVTGLSLAPDAAPHLFGTLAPWSGLQHNVCDVRDGAAVGAVVRAAQPEIVIHMAAQALVREGYAQPLKTIDTNVMGTVHLLEHLRTCAPLAAVLVVTSDKVYENREAGIDFAEDAPLGGHDPYSASKAAAEILTSAYRRSFFAARSVPVVTARAGNVIGGGDWASDRLIPDLWRAAVGGQPVFLRNPASVRPWQHVLEPLLGYLLFVQHCLTHPSTAPPSLNFAPPREPVRTVLEVARRFSFRLGGRDLWTVGEGPAALHESRFLSIDSTSAARQLGWRSHLPVDEAIDWSASWYQACRAGLDMRAFSLRQIDDFAVRAGVDALRRTGAA